MERFIEFVKNHWLLWLALVAILILLIYDQIRDKLSGIQRLSPQELTQMINREEAVVIDIRDRAAFDQGHIIGSQNIEAADLERNMARLEKNKDKSIVIVDGSGQAIVVGTKLRKLGFKVFTLAGGLNAWRNLGLPLTKK